MKSIHLFIAFLLCATPAYAQKNFTVFGEEIVTKSSKDFKDFTKWNRVLSVSKKVTYPVDDLKGLKEMSLDDRLELVNSYINKVIKYKPEKKDYWQSASETFNNKTGDCEDFAIAKYFILRDFGGISAKDMRIITVIDLYTLQPHTVLGILDKTTVPRRVFVLDNQEKNVEYDDKYSARYLTVFSLSEREYEVYDGYFSTISKPQ